MILQYKDVISKLDCSPSAREHYTCVAAGLDTYLQSVVGQHSQMRAVRVTRNMEMKKMSRLELTSAQSRAMQIGNKTAPVNEQVKKLFVSNMT